MTAETSRRRRSRKTTIVSPNVASLSSPGRSIATTRCPAASRCAATRAQHHAPTQVP